MEHVFLKLYKKNLHLLPRNKLTKHFVALPGKVVNEVCMLFITPLISEPMTAVTDIKKSCKLIVIHVTDGLFCRYLCLSWAVS